MAKSAIDAEVNNQIFRKDWPAIIAMRRDLAQISPVRLKNDGNDYLAGQALARKTSDSLFYRWSAISGGTYDSPCILMETVTTDSEDNAASAALARAIFAGYVYKSKLTDYDANWKTAAVAVEKTDATQITVVKF